LLAVSIMERKPASFIVGSVVRRWAGCGRPFTSTTGLPFGFDLTLVVAISLKPRENEASLFSVYIEGTENAAIQLHSNNILFDFLLHPFLVGPLQKLTRGGFGV